MRPRYLVTRWYVEPEKEDWPDGITCVDYSGNWSAHNGRTFWVVLRVERPIQEAAADFISEYFKDDDEQDFDDVEWFTSKREASEIADDHSMGQFLGVR